MGELWDGRYETSRDANRTLEDDVMDAGLGYYSYPTANGNTIRETPTSINYYGPSSVNPGDHFHEGVNINGERYGHP